MYTKIHFPFFSLSLTLDSTEQSLDSLTCRLYVASLDDLCCCAQRFRYYGPSRVAHWQILLIVPLLCLSAHHSRSLCRQRFSLPEVLATRSMHALSESPIQNPSFALVCMQLSNETINYGMSIQYIYMHDCKLPLPMWGSLWLAPGPRLYIEVEVYTRLTVAEATVRPTLRCITNLYPRSQGIC